MSLEFFNCLREREFLYLFFSLVVKSVSKHSNLVFYISSYTSATFKFEIESQHTNLSCLTYNFCIDTSHVTSTCRYKKTLITHRHMIQNRSTKMRTWKVLRTFPFPLSFLWLTSKWYSFSLFLRHNDKTMFDDVERRWKKGDDSSHEEL